MRRWIGPAALYTGVTIVLTWPLVIRLGSVVPHDIGDPVLNAWILWWSTRHLPLTAAWWNAPIFFPMANAMALSEILIGLLPITATVQAATSNPVTAYSVAFLLSFPLCGLAAWALAYEVTGRRDAAYVAGLAFAFAPYRIGQLPHLQMLSYYWAPVALLALHRYLGTRRRAWLAVFASAWLLQALTNGYALFHVSVLVVLWLLWFMRPWRTAIPVMVAWAGAAVPLLPVLLKYREVHRYLHLTRDINEIRRFGADLSGFVAAPAEALVWGSRLAAASAETALFPGLTLIVAGLLAAFTLCRAPADMDRRWATLRTFCAAVALAAAAVAFSTVLLGPWSIKGVITVREFHKPFSIATGAAILFAATSPMWRAAWRDRSVPMFYVAAMAAMYLLALGPEPLVWGRPLLYEPPYAWLMRLPGIEELRVPARFAMLGVLCASTLLAMAVARWRTTSTRPGLVVAIGVGLVLDGAFHLPVPPVPDRGPQGWNNVAAVIELPAGIPATDFAAIYRSMWHRQPIVNGYSGYAPPHYLPLVYALGRHEWAALEELAAYGPLGVAIDQARPTGAALDAEVAALGGATRIPLAPGWGTFDIAERSHETLAVGPVLPIASVRTNRHAGDVGRMLDRNVGSGWASGESQDGHEELVIDLGAARPTAAIVFEMGSFAFGFPRQLDVDVSVDGSEWHRARSGGTALLTIRGALADPSRVPVTIGFDPVAARFIRLRQTGQEPDIPWWIAEIEVHGPA